MYLENDRFEKKPYKASLHNIKPIQGNAAMLRMMQSQNGFIIQREYDDDQKEKFTEEAAMRVLIKICSKHNIDIRDIEFLESAYADMPEPTTKTGINAGNIHYFYDVEAKYTERELAEVLAQNIDIREHILKKERAAKEETALSMPVGTDDQCIAAAIKQLRYYHATSRQFAPRIFEGGLNPNQGGRGQGISTRGIADQTAQGTYNKWSRSYTFLTGDGAEATGYKSKFMNDRREPEGEILDVFTDITSVVPRFEVDPDSKGFKSSMPITEIGYAGRLTDSACQLIKDFVSSKYHKNVDFEKIRQVYASTRL